MKIIGTGLSGLIGTRIVELNSDLDFIEISLEKGINLLDLTTLETIFANNPEATHVLHLAAFTDTNAAWEQKGDTRGLCYQINVVGTQNIVKMCQKYNKYLIHISTDYVFDGQKKTAYVETDLPNPLDWYAETKCLAEKVILDSKLPATIVRIAPPYRSKFDTKVDFIRKIIAKLKNNEVCQLFSDQITTPTFIDDIALGLRQIIDKPVPGIFHLVGSSSQSVYQAGLLIAQTFGFDPKLIQPSSLADYLSTPNARPYAPNLSVSNEKFVKTYAFTPKTLTEGLEEMKKQLNN